LTDPEWLVDGLIPAGGLTVLFGPSGVGKSLLVLSLSAAVATGRPFAGLKVKRGPCLWVALEGSRSIRSRAAAWTLHHHENIGARLFVCSDQIDLSNLSTVDTLLASWNARIQELPVLIVVDCLARAMPGKNENDVKDINLLMAGLTRIQTATGATVILIHHSLKYDDSTERGSSAIVNNADAVFGLAGKEIQTLRCKKMRDGEEPSPLRFVRVKVADSIVCEPTDAAAISADLVLTSTERSVVDALTGVLVGWATAKEIADASHIAHRTVTDALSSLIKREQVEARGSDRSPQRCYRIRPSLTQPNSAPDEFCQAAKSSDVELSNLAVPLGGRQVAKLPTGSRVESICPECETPLPEQEARTGMSAYSGLAAARRVFGEDAGEPRPDGGKRR